jgi:hypothetical protein
MKVRELIAQLQNCDQEAEVHFCGESHGPSLLGRSVEIDCIYPSQAIYGIFTENPRVVSTVLFDTATCGF